jgi:hypothetical protein
VLVISRHRLLRPLPMQAAVVGLLLDTGAVAAWYWTCVNSTT